MKFKDHPIAKPQFVPVSIEIHPEQGLQEGVGLKRVGCHPAPLVRSFSKAFDIISGTIDTLAVQLVSCRNKKDARSSSIEILLERVENSTKFTMKVICYITYVCKTINNLGL